MEKRIIKCDLLLEEDNKLKIIHNFDDDILCNENNGYKNILDCCAKNIHDVFVNENAEFVYLKAYFDDNTESGLVEFHKNIDIYDLTSPDCSVSILKRIISLTLSEDDEIVLH